MKKLIPIIVCAFVLVSFATAQRKPKVDLAKKIADATPSALPQTPTHDRPRTDAQDENLKGKVKSLVEYEKGASPATRKVSKEEYFDESGFFVRDVEYLSYYPEEVTVWGYIGGARVSKSNIVAYAEGERPTMDLDTGAVVVGDASPGDERYTIKHVYKYDEQGRLIEHWYYRNNGAVSSHETYRYEGSRRTQIDYGYDGAEWGRTIDVLDGKGNVVEWYRVGPNNKIEDKYINSYQFDSTGNWVVKKTSRETLVRGKKILKPFAPSYRAIKYYP